MPTLRRTLFLAWAFASLAFDFDDEEDDTAVEAANPAFFVDDAKGASCTLEHSLGGKFSTRSKLFFQNFAAAINANGGKASARVSQAKLSGDDLDAIQALAKDGGFYTLQLPSKLDDPSSPVVSASVSACALVASRFQEQLSLTMSANGHLVALSYVVPVVPPSCSGAAMPRIALDEVFFNTSVSVHFPSEGPKPVGKIHETAFLPPTAAAAARAASSADGKEPADGQPQPPQSFLRKYWMYILPVVLLLTLGGGDPPEGEGGAAGSGSSTGGGGGGGGGGRPAAAAGGGARRRN